MNKYKLYCTGCGLCVSEKKAEFEQDKKGFSRPIEIDSEWCKNVCPASGTQLKYYDSTKVWGSSQKVFLGWSQNEDIRKKASSGGMLTELATYLLDCDLIDEVIHTCVDPASPTKTITTFSRTREELVDKCGSRYSISHPLDAISNLDSHKRYLFIGKPCDVAVLRNYMDLKPELKTVIKYMFSFFCAGLPSCDAQKLLLNKMGTSIEKCNSLTYRGNGWPGYTTAKDANGREFTLKYAEAWGKTLGRDIMRMCRVCLDGIGELADISCGDAWYLGENGKPDFSENEGRNIVFARSEVGLNILNDALQKGYVTLNEIDGFDEYLRQAQYYQFTRRITMGTKIRTMKALFRPVPNYEMRILNTYEKNATKELKQDIAIGTIKRVIKGKL